MFHLISFFKVVLHQELENLDKNLKISNMDDQSNTSREKPVKSTYNLNSTKLHEILHLQPYQKAY